MFRQLAKPIAGGIFRRGLHQTQPAYKGHEFKYVTLDEACVPEGSWKENFDKQQKKFNTHLILGITSFVLTIGIISKFELLFFNYLPPKPREE